MPIRTSCFASALLAACVLASTATAQTQPSPTAPQTVTARDLRFELVPGAAGSATIRVRRGARELLSTTRTSDAFDPERTRPWVFLADANFDGYPDIWVMQAMGMVNTTYSVELFDPRTQSFVPMPDFEALSNPTLDGRNRRITTTERGGCCAHTAATYRWRDARLEMIAEHGDEAATGEDGHVCFVRLWRRERRGAAIVDLPDRFVPLHRFNREAEPAPECRSARPPAGGRALAP